MGKKYNTARRPPHALHVTLTADDLKPGSVPNAEKRHIPDTMVQQCFRGYAIRTGGRLVATTLEEEVAVRIAAEIIDDPCLTVPEIVARIRRAPNLIFPASCVPQFMWNSYASSIAFDSLTESGFAGVHSPNGSDFCVGSGSVVCSDKHVAALVAAVSAREAIPLENAAQIVYNCSL